MNRTVNSNLRIRILKRDNYTCRYCGSKKEPFHLDHVYPYVKGGETSYDNLVTSCSNCNQIKHSKIGIYPKPIGYFDEKANSEFLKSLSSIFPAYVSLFLLVLSISDALHGIREYINIQIIFAGIICFPLFIDTTIKHFRSVFYE